MEEHRKEWGRTKVHHDASIVTTLIAHLRKMAYLAGLWVGPYLY